MDTIIVVRVTVAGEHFWRDAPAEVAFLRNPHRHLFTFEVEMAVDHSDRQREFFLVADYIRERLRKSFDAHVLSGALRFGERSCEQLASWCAALPRIQDDVRRVVVWEDMENGGGVDMRGAQ
jgi:hypothetical protein